MGRKPRAKLDIDELIDGPVLAHPREPPLEWFENDNGELVAAYPLYTSRELFPYRWYPQLFQERKDMLKLSAPTATPFLNLPFDIRLLIYRYCLHHHEAIYPYSWEFRQHVKEHAVEVRLLRTCKTIHDEGSQVFYGENEFRFWEKDRHLEIPGFLRNIGIRHSTYIKNVTMSVPFLGTYTMLRLDWDGCFRSRPSPEKLMNKPWPADCDEAEDDEVFVRYQPGFRWDSYVHDTLSSLANRTSLRQLNLVIPHKWEYQNKYHHHDHRASNQGWDLITYIFWHAEGHLRDANEPIWNLLTGFLRDMPSLKVVLVRVQDGTNGDSDPNRVNHERHMRNMKERLGIWDCRDAELSQATDGQRAHYKHWPIPSEAKGEDPADYLKDLCYLSEEGALWEVERARYEDRTLWNGWRDLQWLLGNR